MNVFGSALRQLRIERQLSLRALSAQVNYDYGYLGQVERGVRKPTEALVRACDRALCADGSLIALHERHLAEVDVPRRTVLRAIGALAVTAPPMIELEALRHNVGRCISDDNDDWQQIVADYGYLYYRLAPDALIRHITADLAVLQTLIVAENRGARRACLSRTTGQLSVLVAMTLAAGGDEHLARRWWSTARRAADESGDIETRVLVRAWEVVNGCYGQQPLAEIVELADEAIALAGPRASAATAGLWAGRAQALALLGNRAEAIASLRRVAEITERLPESVTGAVESLWGWPEHRLRHTESYVFTYIGDFTSACTAQDRAMTLYPTAQQRLRTQVQLHRASCLVQSGDVSGGLSYATRLLTELPIEQRNTPVHRVARQVLAAVPTAERQQPAAIELTDLLKEPAYA
jgi:transcriptional regulator with XRE-family HTH domain